jgi:hypothetical protein
LTLFLLPVDGQPPLLRPARVLIGWMNPEEAALTLAGRQSRDAARPEHQLRVGQARTVAGARRPTLEVAGVVTEPPFWILTPPTQAVDLLARAC